LNRVLNGRRRYFFFFAAAFFFGAAFFLVAILKFSYRNLRSLKKSQRDSYIELLEEKVKQKMHMTPRDSSDSLSST
jgi:hypothetical protein